MCKKTEIKIKGCEEKLKQAMLRSDIAELDALLSPDLVFTNHVGMLMTKQNDLDAHESGALVISDIKLSDQKIVIYDGIVIVSVKASIKGSFANEKSDNDFRFTRVWRLSSGGWQVIAGHSSLIC